MAPAPLASCAGSVSSGLRRELENGNTKIAENASATAAMALSAALTELGPGPYQLRVLLLGGGVYATEGCLLLMLSIVAKGLAVRWELTTASAGGMAGVLLAGLLCGTALGGFACDRFGRRAPILAAYGGLTIFTIAAISSPGLGFLIAAKFMLGIFLGLGIPAANAVVAEACPAGHRSNIYCMTMALFSSGQLYSASILWALSPSLAPEDLHWRASFAAAAVLPAALLGLAYFWLPESILWLLSQNQFAEAKHCLASARHCNCPAGATGSQEEAEAWAARAMDQSCEGERSGAPGNYDTMTSSEVGAERYSAPCHDLWRVEALFAPLFRQTTYTMIFVTCSSNFAYYGMIYGLPETLREATAMDGSGGYSPAAGVFLSALCEIPGVCLAVVMGLTIGRRTSMSIAFGSCSICLLIGVYAMHTGQMVNNLGMAAVFGVKLFLASAYIVVYLYILECYPTTCRATGLAFCMVCGRMGAACCPVLFEGLHFLGLGHAWFFVVMACLLSLASFACRMLPYETKDAELQSEAFPGQYSN